MNEAFFFKTLISVSGAVFEVKTPHRRDESSGGILGMVRAFPKRSEGPKGKR